ncbi:hypothetical protein RRG08_005664 [Elysia crispata]|uniref:Uncharacterized protein n=1 Tax=Elysia crispata TaxID=231223 RepID=A0AAE1CWZ6_9GAST|nr:hypothetical protein RRG08_005664 [Elysia crispata]
MAQCHRAWPCVFLTFSVVLQLGCFVGLPGHDRKWADCSDYICRTKEEKLDYGSLNACLEIGGFICNALSLISIALLMCFHKDISEPCAVCVEAFATFLSFLSAIFFIIDLIIIATWSSDSAKWREHKNEMSTVRLDEVVPVFEIILDALSFISLICRLCSRTNENTNYRYRKFSNA